MIQKLLWTIAWFLIKNLLQVAQGLIEETFKAVKEAEELEMSPAEKKQYVFDHMIEYMTLTRQTFMDTSKVNALIELALVTIRSGVK